MSYGGNAMKRPIAALRRAGAWVTTIAVTVTVAGVAPAHALVAFPSWVITPGSGPLGTTFTAQVQWPTDTPPGPVGCGADVAYRVLDPNGNDMADGTMSADGSPIQFTLIAPDPLGAYLIVLPDTQYCEGTLLRGGEFEVTGPTPPPPPTTTVTLLPSPQTADTGTAATVTATVDDDTSGAPVAGTPISFTLVGPNAGATGNCNRNDCTTNADGQVTWTYTGTVPGTDTITAATAAGSAGEATVVWSVPAHGAAYAALGDSFSAGEGAPTYLPGTDVAGFNTCHRSPLAYGPRLDLIAHLGVLAFVACSGDITDDLFNPNHNDNNEDIGQAEPAQLCQAVPVTAAGTPVEGCPFGDSPAVGSATRTITLTIGGNDTGFVPVVTDCVFASGLHLNHGTDFHDGRGCATRPSVTIPAYTRLLELAGLHPNTVELAPAVHPATIHSIASVLAAIHALAPNGHVYLAGYPQLFQDAGRGDCTVGSLTYLPTGTSVALKIAPSDALFLDDAAATLDTIEAAAAARAGSWATYVDVQQRFAGHGICTSSPWLNPISGTLSAALIATTAQEGLHPSAAGQFSGYQAAFTAAHIGG